MLAVGTAPVVQQRVSKGWRGALAPLVLLEAPPLLLQVRGGAFGRTAEDAAVIWSNVISAGSDLLHQLCDGRGAVQ